MEKCDCSMTFKWLPKYIKVPFHVSYKCIEKKSYVVDKIIFTNFLGCAPKVSQMMAVSTFLSLATSPITVLILDFN